MGPTEEAALALSLEGMKEPVSCARESRPWSWRQRCGCRAPEKGAVGGLRLWGEPELTMKRPAYPTNLELTPRSQRAMKKEGEKLSGGCVGK